MLVLQTLESLEGSKVWTGSTILQIVPLHYLLVSHIVHCNTWNSRHSLPGFRSEDAYLLIWFGIFGVAVVLLGLELPTRLEASHDTINLMLVVIHAADAAAAYLLVIYREEPLFG